MELTANNKSKSKHFSFKNNDKNEKSAKQALKDLGIYLVFILVTTIISLSSREIGMFYFNNTIERLFLNRFTSNKHGLELAYEDLVTIADWWSFAETTFIESIGQFENKISTRNESVDGNVLLGPPRLRQIRVQNESCKLNRIFENEFKTCYGHYTESREDVSPFLNKDHSSQSQANTYGIIGSITNYHGGGYIEILTFEKEQNEEILGQLREAYWVDSATRIILLEFALFNSNVNLFCNAKLLAEIPPTGGVVTTSQLQALKYSPLWNDGSYLVILSAVLFFGLIFYFTVDMTRKVLSKGCVWVFGSVFQMLHILVLMFGYMMIVYVTWHTFYLKSILRNYQENANQFLSLDIICYWNQLFIDMMGICVFFVWLQIFKYTEFNKTMMQFSTTLQRCAKDLLGFSIMFAIVFVAFAYLAVMIFGSVHSDFCSFSRSIFTLMRTVLGDFDYEKLEAANRVLGPIFFISFILFVFFVLMNMFLAIINDTYSDVMSETTEESGNQVGEYKLLLQKLKRYILRIPKEEVEHEMQIEEPSVSGARTLSNIHIPTEEQQPKNVETIIDK